MALDVFSQFYYGFTIDNENRFLNISEGGPELSVELEAGSFSFTEGAVMVQNAFNIAGALGYTVSTNRSTRTLTISATGTWDALIQSGTLAENQAWDQIGFTGAVDLTGATDYTGDSPVVQKFEPQFWLQDYTKSTHKQKKAESTVRKTATGAVEVVTFGLERMMKCAIMFSTSLPMDDKVIRNNPTGVEDLLAFMEFCITKAQLEFMEDVATPNNFETMILESTEQGRDGTEFELKEMVAQNLPDFYEVKGLTFRVIE
jgi:hypothetical protein